MAQKRTVADNIRQSVHSKIETVKADKVKPIVSELNAKPAAERNERLLAATAAVYRAVSDPNYSLNPNHAKDYAAAVDIIAQKRGIKPDKNGRFNEDQLKGALSPEELMRASAAQYLHDAGDSDATRQAVNDQIKSVYDNDETKAQPAMATVGGVPSYKTDEEFLAMDQEAQEEYLTALGGYEKDRLQNLIVTKANQDTEEDILKGAGEFDGRMGDPDWGHKKDDDDFKIDQGDIIEYLMKDVILATAAWVGNKGAGIVGIVGYELGSAAVNEVRPLLRKANEARQEGWEKLSNKLFGKDKEKALTEEEKAQKENQEKLLKSFYESYHNNVEASKQAIEIHSLEDTKATAAFKKLQRQLIKHYAVLDDDGIAFPVIEDKGLALPLSKQDYATFFGADGAEAGKAALKQIQKNYDNYQLSVMMEGKSDSEKAEIRQWFTEYTKATEEGVRNNNPNIPLPAGPKSQEYKDSYDKARQAALTRLKFNSEAQTFEAQKQLFGNHYLYYRLFEERRLNPESDIFTHEEKRNEFIEKTSLEADIIFLKAEQERHNGNTAIPSRERLISTAEGLAEASKTAILEDKSQTPINDTLKTLVAPPTDENERKTLLDAARDISAETLLLSERKNCETRISELEGAKGQNDQRRKLLDQTKKKIGLMDSKKTELSKDSSTQGVNLSQVKIHRGGKL